MMLRLVAIVAASAAGAIGGDCSCQCCSAVKPETTLLGSRWQCAYEHDECGNFCTVDAEAKASFLLSGDEMQYLRWCAEACSPEAENLDASCMQHELKPANMTLVDIPDYRRSGFMQKKKAKLHHAPPKAPAQAPKTPPMAPKKKHHSLVSAKTRAQMAAENMSLQQAKTAYMEAFTLAQQAGESARMAKSAYELARRAPALQALRAAETLVDEIHREAREDATEAMNVRKAYEAAATKAAQGAAKGAAAVYQNAQKNVQAVQAEWGLRVGQFAGAASQLRSRAEEQLGEAAKFRALDPARSRQAVVLARTLEDQAMTMDAKSAAAKAEADRLAGTIPWYTTAARAAAANMLGKSTPYDMLPPPLPPGV